MANIPSHMKLQGDLIAMRRAPKTSNLKLVVMGLAIGFAVAAAVLLGGLIH